MELKRPWIFIITLSVAVISVGLFFVALVQGWYGPISDDGAIFCEAARPGLIKQPANTFSNFGFVFAGLLMAWQLSRGIYKSNNSLTNTFFYPTFFSCLAVLLGPGSMAMHATLSNIGGFLDMLSMYLVCSFTLAYSCQRFFSWKPIHFTVIFAIVLSICLWGDNQPYHIVFDYFGNALFCLFCSLTVVVEILNTYVRKMHHQIGWGLAALGSILLALGIWNMSQTGDYFCHPYSVIQGHAIWHLLDAFSVYGLFRFYVSEHKTPAPATVK